MKNKARFNECLKHRPDAPFMEDYESSVHMSDKYERNRYRLNKAKEQVMNHPPVKLESTCSHGIKFFDEFGISAKASIEYNPLAVDTVNAIWCKQTQEEGGGYLGALCHGKVNFQMPANSSQYDERWFDPSSYKWKWVYNASGILCHQLGMSWDTKKILYFKLRTIPEGYTLEQVKRALGAYLIDCGIPIVDFYSHQIISKEEEEVK